MTLDDAGDERAPWALPETFKDPLWIYEAARGLGDESEKDWSFSLLAARLSVLGPTGLDRTYEPLRTWREVVSALALKRMLESRGYTGPLNYSLSTGFSVYDSALRTTTGRLSPPNGGEAFRGRHVVALSDYDEGRNELVFRNSWGERWGHQGFGFMSESYFQAFVDDVILYRPAWAGPSPAMSAVIREIGWKRGRPGSEDFSMWPEAWMQGRNTIKAKEMRLHDRQHHVMRRMLHSFAGLPYDVAEIREDQILKGRLHLIHDRENGISTAWEFWVPKEERRQGYGATLFGVAVELMGYVRTTELRIPVHEADASAMGLARAARFARSMGCGWQLADPPTRRPVTLATADKKVR
jgi:hypothetical protein